MAGIHPGAPEVNSVYHCGHVACRAGTLRPSGAVAWPLALRAALLLRQRSAPSAVWVHCVCRRGSLFALCRCFGPAGPPPRYGCTVCAAAAPSLRCVVAPAPQRHPRGAGRCVRRRGPLFALRCCSGTAAAPPRCGSLCAPPRPPISAAPLLRHRSPPRHDALCAPPRPPLCAAPLLRHGSAPPSQCKTPSIGRGCPAPALNPGLGAQGNHRAWGWCYAPPLGTKYGGGTMPKRSPP